MNFTPPTGSNISVKTNDTGPVIAIPYQRGGPGRYLHGLFLLAWLGFWAFAFNNVLSEVMSGKATGFTVFWLAGWTVGGVLVAYLAYGTFRPSVPETLELRSAAIGYDSGVEPFQMNFTAANQREAWKSIFQRRTILELDRKTLRSLRLRPTDTGNRLTVDAGATRIDLAKSASEIEREWLYRLLANKYSIPSETGGSAGVA